VLTIFSTTADARKRILKRILDVFVSVTALVVLLPLLIFVWGFIRFTSKGPAFFVQQRVGLNQRLFKFYKFRTMVEEAPALQDALDPLNEMNGAIFKIRKDPRVTSLGRMLRKTSIDELPQLVNVLLGDMSLVGPRPLPVHDVARLDIALYGRRFGVKPGITGLWQISGRNAVSFDRMMALDIQYTEMWSVMGDVAILLRTVPVVLSMRGAY
jgi:lipopolysaccharide/colanic/teichoic acid biosynthesis glycosyltransferase